MKKLMTGLVFGIAALTLSAAAIAQSVGFAVFYAQVNPDGSIGNSSGVASATHAKTGIFKVTVLRPILASCVFNVSITGTSPGTATAYTNAGNLPSTIVVDTFNPAGAPANLAFTVLVHCAS